MSSDPEEDGPPPLAPGELLAPAYQVVSHLRRGEDLDVYDLWSEERDCRCIGKTVRPDRLEARGARARLLREGRLLLRLTHPHIVRAYEVQTGPPPLVVLETLPGETLAHLIDRHPRGMSPRDVAQLGLHLCAAVGYLHRNGALHLDIKPSNVVAIHGLAKVLDLSLARAPGRYRGGTGTSGYMAPEQIEGGEYGAHTDVWEIGATLFEALTGEPACEVGDESEESGTNDDLPQAVCLPRTVRRARHGPNQLATAIDRSLSADSAARPTVAELMEMLQATPGLPAPSWPRGAA